ncbi:MAG: hypothetical protein RR614_08740 [Eubacterium sp.]
MKKSIIVLIFTMCVALLLTFFMPDSDVNTEKNFDDLKTESETQSNVELEKEKTDKYVIEYNSWEETQARMQQDLADLNDETKLPGKEYAIEIETALMMDDTQQVKVTFSKTIKK